MRLVVSQYDPDAIVMLVGGNDMVIPLVQGEDYDPNFTRDEPRYWNWVISRFAIRPLSAWRGSFYRRTAIWQLARWAKSLRRISTHAMDTRGQFFANARRERQQRKVQQDKLPSLEPGLYEYDHNLRAIIEEARKRSIRIILLTQPSFWKDVMSPEEDRLLFYGFGERPTERTEKSVLYSPRALKAAMDMYNQRLLRICSDLNVECFDVASRLPKTMDVYFDDLHYTEQGAARFAQEVAAYLKGTAPFVSAAERADD
jgi:lysophospholipase L1-like esterase